MRVFFLLFLIAGLFASASAPRANADAPATQPAEVSQASIARQLSALAAVDARVREQARFELMGLDPADLDALKAAAIAAAPLAPSQKEALKEIVWQVYASSLSYAADSNQGFLGLSWDAPPDLNVRDELGIRIEKRIPGFCSYRALEDGDIILSVVGEPSIDCR